MTLLMEHTNKVSSLNLRLMFLALAVMLYTVLPMVTITSLTSTAYASNTPAYVMNITFEGYNRTSFGFIEQSEFSGTAAVFVRPINSSFTEVTVRFSGVLSPGIEPISMSEAWESLCFGSNPSNCSWEVVKVKLNTTNFMQFQERRVNFTLRYVVMNKYNYAWDESTGEFIGFLPFYVVPDMRWHADWNKLPKKFLYLGRVIRVQGQVVNVLTGEWKPIPLNTAVRIRDHHKLEIPAIWLCTKYGFMEVTVIHHYVVCFDGFFKLPFRELDGVYIGNYSYVYIEGGVLRNLKFLKYLKSIDDVPPGVSIIDWETIRAWVTIITVVGSSIACVVYLIRRRRRR